MSAADDLDHVAQSMAYATGATEAAARAAIEKVSEAMKPKRAVKIDLARLSHNAGIAAGRRPAIGSTARRFAPRQ